jgi:2-haloacid dehalogenase
MDAATLWALLPRFGWLSLPRMRTEVISFDCYGTLVDWESGILGALREMASGRNVDLSDEAILSTYAEIEPALQGGSYRSYRSILKELAGEFARRFGFEATEAECHALPDSIARWEPFPDTVPALRALKARYKLAILSNIDNDLLAGTLRRLEVPFDWLVTAEEVRSYKPGPAHFEELLRRTGLPREEHLHAAESLFHDIAPARALGIPNVWVQRANPGRGAKASRVVEVAPDRTVADLRGLADLLL